MDLVEAIAQAIAGFEGFFTPGTLAQRNNNPGNLRSWGNLPTSGGYAVFPTPEAGWEALRSQIRLNISRGLSLLEFFAGKPGVYAGYAPSADQNRPAAYATYVSQRTGLPPDVPLDQLAAPAEASSATPWLPSLPSIGLPSAPGSGAPGLDAALIAGLVVFGASLLLLLLR